MPLLVKAQESAMEFEGVKVLDVFNSIGEIVISGDDNASKTTVKFKKNKTREDCNLIAEMSSDRLNIEQKAPATSRNQCETDILVKVPHKDIDLKLVITNSRGDVSVNNYAGDLDIKVESGNLKVTNSIINEGNIFSSKGGAKFENIQASEVFLNLDDGNASVGFEKILTKGKFEIRVKSGNADITIPSIAAMDTSYVVGEARASGSVGNKQSSTPAGRYNIELYVPNGNFSVNKK